MRDFFCLEFSTGTVDNIVGKCLDWRRVVGCAGVANFQPVHHLLGK